MKRFLVVAGRAFIVLVVILAGVSRVAGADGDARLGTWKLNLSKSNYSPGPPPKSQVRKWEPFEGDGVTFTVETVNADGSRTTERIAPTTTGRTTGQRACQTQIPSP
jgi:hypothetical protein